MGKGWAYLALAIIGALLLWTNGRFDEVAGGTNLRDREAYWQDQADRAALQDAGRADVDAFAARHGLVLECTRSAAGPDVTECVADDHLAKGGTATHPMTLQLFFMFYGDRLHTFTSSPRSLE